MRESSTNRQSILHRFILRLTFRDAVSLLNLNSYFSWRSLVSGLSATPTFRLRIPNTTSSLCSSPTMQVILDRVDKLSNRDMDILRNFMTHDPKRAWLERKRQLLRKTGVNILAKLWIRSKRLKTLKGGFGLRRRHRNYFSLASD